MDLKKISVIIVTKDAQNTLLDCLNSIKDFGEIIVLNNQSSDNTVKIAKKFQEQFGHLKIYESQFIGFGPLKNLALSFTHNDWILSIDSDEILEQDALKELQELHPKQNDILIFPRKNLYNGTWIKACGWWPDRVLRVFNKKHTCFNENLVHESLILQDNTHQIKLKNALLHYSFNNIENLLDKLQRYSSLWAKQNMHKESGISKAILRGFWNFFRNYFFKKGIFYGYKGFIISVCNAMGAFFKYIKLYELKIQKPKSCSLIITIYNQKERLALVLESVKRLDPLPNEVLIADDGSKEDTVKLIQQYQKNFPCILKHIWQEDKGFRAAASRNKAIKATINEYIILIDGDMILDKNFIKDHLKFSSRKTLLQGSRTILTPKETQKILIQNNFYLALKKKGWKNKRNSFLSKIIHHFSRLDKNFFYKQKLIKSGKTCNISFYKSDFEAINGFNEKFIGWGREDSEFIARFLFNDGVLKRLKFTALAYHLHHEENSKNMLEENHQIYLNTLKNKSIKWNEI